MFRRFWLIIGAVAFVVGAYALPALAQEEAGTEEGAACAEVAQNVQEILTEHGEGGITAEEAAAEITQELESAAAAGVTCSEAQVQELASSFEQMPGASDVASILLNAYAPAEGAA